MSDMDNKTDGGGNDGVLTYEAALSYIACCLPDNLTEDEKAIVASTVARFLDATPVRGGNRVAILRDLGWTHGVCYKRDMQLLIAVMCAIGRGEEQWARMPRRGRPKSAATVAAEVQAAASAASAASAAEVAA